jgi:hypothetical protein
MKPAKLLGLLIASSLLVGFEPVAEAAPASTPGSATELVASDGLVVKTVTRAGVAHRSARRTSRRVGRRHGY